MTKRHTESAKLKRNELLLIWKTTAASEVFNIAPKAFGLRHNRFMQNCY